MAKDSALLEQASGGQAVMVREVAVTLATTVPVRVRSMRVNTGCIDLVCSDDDGVQSGHVTMGYISGNDSDHGFDHGEASVLRALDLDVQKSAHITFGSSREAEKLLVHFKPRKGVSVALTRGNLHCLRPTQQLLDEPVNLAILLLQARDGKLRDAPGSPGACHIFSTFFYTKLTEHDEYEFGRVTPALPLTSMRRVLVPINVVKTHWFLIEIDMKEQALRVYDSVEKSASDYATYFRRLKHYISSGRTLPRRLTLGEVNRLRFQYLHRLRMLDIEA
uniref:Putative Leucine-rich repeat (LRR) protein, homolog of Volvox carteri MTF0684/MTM0041 n=1 Tax=Yamagishiella unicocca TaxID=51707 RepID=A0A2Z5X8D5_9CHLO|nr:putative Leucine-rich repeat (LRR) protein, homolog of Volvox carteri MTF0684/MTM0041 [Yamagishiella unicocca]